MSDEDYAKAMEEARYKLKILEEEHQLKQHLQQVHTTMVKEVYTHLIKVVL